MLSYIVLCCGLLYVQASTANKTTCSVREIIRRTNELLEENFENCDCSQSNSCLCLPTRWDGCELACFADGFQRMKEKFNPNDTVMKRINPIHRSLRTLLNKKCENLESCKDPCLPTATGNVTEFLTGLKTAFQKVEKQTGGKK